MHKNLNNVLIKTDANDQEQTDFSTRNNNIEVYFKDLETRLIDKINEADAVVGCVAWLTNFNILYALAKKETCSIIVQKEDFLRPDDDSVSSATNYNMKLKTAYENIKGILRYKLPLLSKLSQCWDLWSEGVRCVGNHNSDKNPACPRAHHKFIVFCHKGTECKCDEESQKNTDENFCNCHELKPYAVWTGSFNFTKNATMSFENAVFINDPIIAEAYINEYQQIFSLSETLNWKNKWVSPEYRIGT